MILYGGGIVSAGGVFFGGVGTQHAAVLKGWQEGEAAGQDGRLLQCLHELGELSEPEWMAVNTLKES